MSKKDITINDVEFKDKITSKFAKYKLDKINAEDKAEFELEGEKACNPLKVEGKKNKLKLFKYQKFLVKYFEYHTRKGNDVLKSRGILLRHGMGSGKTITAIKMALGAREEAEKAGKKTLRIYFLIQASLHDDPWTKELFKLKVLSKKLQGQKRKLIDEALKEQNIYILHYNANNLVKKLKEIEMEGHNLKNAFSDSIIVIDESHNFINTVRRTNPELKGKKDASIPMRTQVYEKMLSAKNAKFILLSGTPIINHSYEIIYYINLLRNTPPFKILGTDSDEIDFVEAFFDKDTNKMINKEKLYSLTNGIISSYVGGMSNVFPEKIEFQAERLGMSQYQFDADNELLRHVQSGDLSKKISHLNVAYRTNRVKAMHAAGLTFLGAFVDIAAGGGDDKNDDRFDPITAFRMMISNGSFPEISKDNNQIQRIRYIVKNDVDMVRFIKTYFGTNYVINLNKYSPKTLRILQNSRASEGPVLVYSTYKAYGIHLVQAALDLLGYKEFKGLEKINFDEPMNRYIIWSGDTDDDVKNVLLENFNDVRNAGGEHIKFILVTQAGKEGITLKGVRQVHIMEPYWNDYVKRQIIGRAVRICSHHHLPKEKRNVVVFKYLSLYTTEQRKAMNEKDKKYDVDDDYERNIKPINELIAYISNGKQQRLDQMDQLLQESSIDCELNFEHNKIGNKDLSCADLKDYFKKGRPMVDEDEVITNFNKAVKSQIKLEKIEFKGGEYMLSGNLVYDKDENKIGSALFYTDIKTGEKVITNIMFDK